MEHLRYPIGKHSAVKEHTADIIAKNLNDIRIFPDNLKELVSELTESDLSKTYREGSWNVKQIIHHIGESHMNAYIRVKLALTEENPTVKPYNENLWVHTPENDLVDIGVSVILVENIHIKLVSLLETLNASDLARTYHNPQYDRTSSLADLIALYSWHGRHHLAHIRLAIEK